MPACFQLFRKGSVHAQKFTDVDNAICAYLEVVANDEQYVNDWYDHIGFLLALGRSFREIGQRWQDCIVKYPKDAEFYRLMLRINHFLMENYQADAWQEIGRG